MPLAVSLAKLHSPLHKAYRNSAHCSETLHQSGGTLQTKYCGQRWCYTCSRIRTARAFDRYTPELELWGEKHFVTLTVQNVPAGELAGTWREMLRVFQSCKLGMRRSPTLVTAIGTDKRTRRRWSGAEGVRVGDVLPAEKLIALRKAECTYNDVRDDYHPHYHVVVQTRAQGVALIQRWLGYWGERATADAQDTRPAGKDSLSELFKYFTKLLTKVRGKTSEAKGTSRPTDPRALDVIFRSMRGMRVYQPVGFRVAQDADDEETEIVTDQGTPAISRHRVAEHITWEWNQSATDWVDASTGECLTGYAPKVNFRRLVERLGPAPPERELRHMRLIDDVTARSELRDDAQVRMRNLLRAYTHERAEVDRGEAGRFFDELAAGHR